MLVQPIARLAELLEAQPATQRPFDLRARLR